MTTKLEQQTLVVSALGSHVFVPDSVAVHFWVHSVLVGALLHCGSLVMLVLVGLFLLVWHDLFAGEGNTCSTDILGISYHAVHTQHTGCSMGRSYTPSKGIWG